MKTVTAFPIFRTRDTAVVAFRIPSVPVRVVVDPIPGDATRRIQRAIDHVAALSPDEAGFRGAVLLSKGRHEIAGGLFLNTSGVILRGEGAHEDGTVLIASGTDRRTLISVAGEMDTTADLPKDEWQIADDRVPVGATSFNVSDASGLWVGEAIRVVRPSTMEWIESLGAREFGGGEGDFRLSWKPGSRDIAWTRTITSIDGRTVTIDTPLTSALDTTNGGGWIERSGDSGRISQIGIEGLALVSEFDSSNPKDEEHAWCAITIENAEDTWVRQVTARHFAGSLVAIYETGRRVTVQDCMSLAPVSEIGGYRRHTFFTMGEQTLFLRCVAENGLHDFAAGHASAGPNAFVQCESTGALGDSGAIESWASGILYDNVNIDGHGLTLGFRGPNPHGAGWAAANSLFWQCSAAFIRCENPPGAWNWAFGSWAEFHGDGVWHNSNEFVSPDSLYEAQLRDRLGPDAADALLLMPRSRSESSNPPMERALELAVEARAPAPQLRDYIADAWKRDPISTSTEDAINVDELPPVDGASQPAPNRRELEIRNGWLTVDGSLLIGGKTGVAWWRGNIRPADAASVGIGVTRFVPGRTGRGFTDDLEALTQSMRASGKTALDHNQGLWYDRRRDDHQRVRRMDGDVWPPFYEQPFARSGIGTAWDGLSRYDLTQFNPWYWKRLKQFADFGDQRGVLLFHQNYFQHNILEAGAHWADSPWRTANNINETGFPEPPRYAGDKRIFMAELFYDVTHPVRRDLHRAYIRQSLDNFADTSNVIQFTSAEYTGPLHFMEFWLDTIAEWQREHPNSSPVIALSATKDVQDAILEDARRADIVDVIDFRYWWRTPKGEFAPPGGASLAPRQFERRWRGGRPGDDDLAEMASEYRRRFPGQPVISNFESAGWAWLCAGGSQARIPASTDERLLRHVPDMKAVAASKEQSSFVLARSGRHYLACGKRGEVASIDLSDESGVFDVYIVDPKSGALTNGGTVEAGATRKFDDRIVWLQKR